MNKITITILISIIVSFGLSAVFATAGGRRERGDSTFVVPVDSVIREYRKNRIFIVDVRSRKAFETIRIPGSVNVPLHAVKTRPFLKALPIVLVNEGFEISILESTCRYLNQNGFKAGILQGGLNGWRYKEGLLEGDILAAGRFGAVPSRIFHLEKETVSTIVVDVSRKRSEASKQLIPAAIHLPAIGVAAKQNRDDITFGDLRAAVKDIMSIPNASVLIVNQNGSGYERIVNILAETYAGPVFYLQGGVAGYERFLKYRDFSRQPRMTRVRTINECSICGEKTEDRGLE